jgi:peptidoglycan/LPS O-acetylase OafA/YrhL
MKQATASTGRIIALDGWRGISALMVVAAHIINNRYDLGNFATSDTGVLIFFAISGFIITKLAISEYAKQGRFSIGRFYIRRALRILPPFFTFLACVFVASTAGWVVQDRSQVFAAGAFLCLAGGLRCQWFVAHSASLSYEEMFYLVFPLIFFLFAARPRFAFGAILLGLVTFLLLRRSLQFHVSLVTVTVAMFIFICSGAVAAAFESVVKRIALSSAGTALWLLAAAIVIAKIIYSSNYQVPVSAIDTENEAPLPLIFKLLPVAVTWLVVGSIYGGSRIFSLLTWQPLVWVGQISYSLYLWQQLFTGSRELYTATSPLLIPPLMFAAAAASYYWIELPCRHLSKRLMASLRKDQARFGEAEPGQMPP